MTLFGWMVAVLVVLLLLALLLLAFRRKQRRAAPVLVASAPGVYLEDGTLYLALPFDNPGAVRVLQATVESVRAGSGTLLAPAALPVVLGDIAPHGRAVLDASLALQGEPAGGRLPVTVSGSCVVDGRKLGFTQGWDILVPRPAGQAEATSVSVEPRVQRGSPFPPQPLPGPREAHHEQAEVPPIPIGPLRQAATYPAVSVRLPGPGPGAPPPEAPAPRGLFDPLVVTRNASFAPDAGNPPDMSGASAGGVVFATANTFGAVSLDDGQTFTEVDPSTIWSDVFAPRTDGAGNAVAGGLCCDQVVRYLPTIDRFVWFLQFNTVSAPKGGLINMVRVAVAKPADIRARGIGGDGVWTYWDMTSATFGLGENWMDYPDMAVGANFLYFSINKVNTGGFVVRIPLAELRDGATLHMNYTAPGVCAKMTRNAATELFWGVLGSTSSVVVYSWKEDTNVYSWRTVPLTSWNGSDFTAPDPAGNAWILGVAGFFNVQGAARRYAVNPLTGGYLFNELWFAWNSGRGAGSPYPAIELIRLDAGTFKLIQQVRIRNDEHAFAYPDLVANEGDPGQVGVGDVAIAFLWGGNRFYGNPGVGLFRLGTLPDQQVRGDNTELVSVGTSDFSPDGGRSGDYLTVGSHWPSTGAFSAFVYQVLRDSTVPAGWRWDCRAIRFGRASAFGPLEPPPR